MHSKVLLNGTLLGSGLSERHGHLYQALRLCVHSSYFVNQMSVKQAADAFVQRRVFINRRASGSSHFPSKWNVFRWVLHIIPPLPGVSHTGCRFVRFLQPVINTGSGGGRVEYSTAERETEKREEKKQGIQTFSLQIRSRQTGSAKASHQDSDGVKFSGAEIRSYVMQSWLPVDYRLYKTMLMN